MTEDEAKRRTLQQNKAIHKYCTMVAEQMDAAGFDAQTAITLPIQLTGAIVKENIFKVIMKALYPEKTSTTELETHQVDVVHQNMARALAEKFSIDTPFPNKTGE